MQFPFAFFLFFRFLVLPTWELGVLLFRAQVHGDLAFGGTGDALLEALLKNIRSAGCSPNPKDDSECQ